jgi:hypothetical protein
MTPDTVFEGDAIRRVLEMGTIVPILAFRAPVSRAG